MDIIERLIEFRKSAGLSANQLAKLAGIGQSSLSDIENRKAKPSFDTLERLCDALGITLSQFFANDENDLPYDLQRLISAAKTLSPDQRELLTKFIESMKKDDSHE